MPLGEVTRRMRIVPLARRFYVRLLRRTRNVALSTLFLATAFVVVAVAMVGLGNWAGTYLNSSISRGVSETAASSIDALIANSLRGLGPERPASAETRSDLDEVFRVGNEADTTRLLQIRIRDVEGRTIYEALGGIAVQDLPADFAAAVGGKAVSRVGDLERQSVGAVPAARLPVMQILTPIRDRETGEVFAVADLYYSARAIADIQRRAQLDVWAVVSLTGLAVAAALYFMVARVGQIINSQRARLARSLNASRRLADENEALHVASERLRVDAALSNEELLSNVGSDLHDGPIQLLTLLILRLSKNARDISDRPALTASLNQTVDLATGALEEMRSISSGLVLPELADVTLEDTVLLAIGRHEATTGKSVEKRVAAFSTPAPMTVKICAYRVVQEALNNAFWHGDTTAAVVTADVVDGTLHLEVSNQTTGVSGGPDPAPQAESIGMRSMRFRVEALGGRFQFDMPSLSQAIIRADIPIDGRNQLVSSISAEMPLPSTSRPD